MCVDYTNLNNACPKDSFPLPQIDQIVDSTTGQGMLSFLDAFSGYHQIPMSPDDEEKTAFITPHGLYCYKVMCRPSILSLDTGIYPSGVTSTHRSHMAPLGHLLGLVGVRASCGFVCGPLWCICGPFSRVTMAILLVVHSTL